MAGGSFAALVALCAAFKAAGTLGGWVMLTSTAGQLAVELRAPAPEPRAPSRANYVANGVLLTVIVLVIAQPSIARQFTLVINAAVIFMLCVYAMAGAALVRLQGGASTPAGWGARALGAGAVLLVAAIMTTQETPMLLTTAVAVLAAVAGWTLLGAWSRRRKV